MKVCDVCFSPENLTEVTARYLDAGIQRSMWTGGQVPDLCPTCLDLLKKKAFQEIAERAHQGIIKRITIPEPQT